MANGVIVVVDDGVGESELVDVTVLVVESIVVVEAGAGDSVVVMVSTS